MAADDEWRNSKLVVPLILIVMWYILKELIDDLTTKEDI